MATARAAQQAEEAAPKATDASGKPHRSDARAKEPRYDSARQVSAAGEKTAAWSA